MKKIVITLFTLIFFISCSEKEDSKTNNNYQEILKITGEGGVTICECISGNLNNQLSKAQSKEEYDSLFQLLTKQNANCLSLEQQIGHDDWTSVQKECN
tara:strand:- start:4267 stop:4563 length:297 start_codon:yes stop_codon:yes gene_type:complete